MSWGSPQAFFAMGGYALYVWGSYAVAAACIVVELWLLRLRRRTMAPALSRRNEDCGPDHVPRQT
jgi:heme exporter protein D